MAEACRIVDVDGEAIRVRGGAAMSPDAVELFAEVVRAAKAKLAADPPRTLDHEPCCSSHGVAMTCARYRRTHFVDVRPCCATDAERLALAADPTDSGKGDPDGRE